MKGHVLYNENDKVDNIFLIKEGEVELSIKKNILELNNLVLNQKEKYLNRYKNDMLTKGYNLNIKNLQKGLAKKINVKRYL